MERAKEIALEDAGLAAADVTFTKEKLDVDDGSRSMTSIFMQTMSSTNMRSTPLQAPYTAKAGKRL